MLVVSSLIISFPTAAAAAGGFVVGRASEGEEATAAAEVVTVIQLSAPSPAEKPNVEERGGGTTKVEFCRLRHFPGRCCR